MLVVGGGNSGAQILAEVSQVADAAWVTPGPPSFLPDEVDGRALFEGATAHPPGDGVDRRLHRPHLEMAAQRGWAVTFLAATAARLGEP